MSSLFGAPEAPGSLFIPDDYLLEGFSGELGQIGTFSVIGESPRARVAFVNADGRLVDRLTEARVEPDSSAETLVVTGTSEWLRRTVQVVDPEEQVVTWIAKLDRT